MWMFKKKREELPDAEPVPEVCVNVAPAPPLTPRERRKNLIDDIRFDISWAIDSLKLESERDISCRVYQVIWDLEETLIKCDKLRYEEDGI